MGKGGSLAPPPQSFPNIASCPSSTPATVPGVLPPTFRPHHIPTINFRSEAWVDGPDLLATRQYFRAVVLAQLTHVLAARRATPILAPKLPTTFLVDWDDTCLCTTALEAAGAMADFDAPTSPALAAALDVLELRVLSLLKTANTLGKVLIVTNAGDRWVELSAGRFLPAVRAFLDEHWRDVKIISARARYAEQFPTAPLQWKARTFADELAQLHPHAHLADLPASVVVLGDSVGDQYAAHAAIHEMTRIQQEASIPPPAGGPHTQQSTSMSSEILQPQLPHPTDRRASPINLLLKVVKFLERPTVDQLSKELAVLLDHLRAMTAYMSSFDVSMYNEGDRESRTQAVGPMTAAVVQTTVRPSGAIHSPHTSEVSDGDISHSSSSNRPNLRSPPETATSVVSLDSRRSGTPVSSVDYQQSTSVEHCETPMEVSC